MNSIPITENTTVKLIVRSGTEMERRNIILSEGEPGYTLDTQRFFIGDGRTPGGINVSTRFIGQVNTIADAYIPNSPPLPGDLAHIAPGTFAAGLYILKSYPIDLSGRPLSSWGSQTPDWFRLVQTDFDPTSAMSAGTGLSYTYDYYNRVIDFDRTMIGIDAAAKQLFVGPSINLNLSTALTETVSPSDTRRSYGVVISDNGSSHAGGIAAVDLQTNGAISLKPANATASIVIDDEAQTARTIVIGTATQAASSTAKLFIANQSSRILFGNNVSMATPDSVSGAYVGFMGNPAAIGGGIAMVSKDYGTSASTFIFTRYRDTINNRWAFDFDASHTVSVGDTNVQSNKTLKATAVGASIQTSKLQVVNDTSSLSGTLEITQGNHLKFKSGSLTTALSGSNISINSGAIITTDSGSLTNINGSLVVGNSGILIVTPTAGMSITGGLSASGANVLFDRLRVSDINPGQTSFFQVDAGISATFNGITTLAGTTLNTGILTNSGTLNSSNTILSGNVIITDTAILSGDNCRSSGKFIFNGNGGASPTTRIACDAANANAVLFNGSTTVGIDGRLFLQSPLSSNSNITTTGTIACSTLSFTNATVNTLTFTGTGSPTLSNSGGAIRPSRFGIQSVTTSNLPAAPADLEIVYDNTRGAVLMYHSTGGWMTVDGVGGDIKQTIHGAIAACYRNPGWAIYNPARGRLLGGSTENGADAFTGGPYGGQAGALLGGSTQRGGEIAHTLTIPEIPSHKHTYEVGSGGSNPNLWNGSQNNSNTPIFRDTTSTGGDGAHNNIPSYIAFTTLVKDYNNTNGAPNLQATINASNASLVFNG